MGNFLDNQAEGTNAQLSSAQAMAEARQARNQAYAQAYKLEDDSAAGLELAGENLMRMQQNRELQLGAVRAGQAARGFALSGSKRQAEVSFARVLDAAIADAVRSTATQDANARVQAAMLRHEGDAALRMGHIKKTYYDRMQSISKSMAPWYGIGDATIWTGKFMSSLGLDMPNAKGQQ